MPTTRSGKGGKKVPSKGKGKKGGKKEAKKDAEGDVQMKQEDTPAQDAKKQEDVVMEGQATGTQRELVQCDDFDDGLEVMDTKPGQADTLFRKVIALDDPDGKYVKLKEKSIYNIGKIYARQRKVAEMKQLLVDINFFFAVIPKARTAKIVRELIDIAGRESDNNVEIRAALVDNAIAWCKREKRTFLKQRMECVMAGLLQEQQKYKEALKICQRLVRDVKKFDDKLLLIEVELVESRVYLCLKNIPKAKGALTAGRSAANSVYCPPLLQAQIDLLAGTLCAEENDYKTAFSYFYEAFEGFNTINDKHKAVLCLKYMLLGKIMTDTPEDVYAIANGKAGVKYAGVEVEAMRSVADAYKKRSIQDFESAYEKFKPQLSEDPIINSHLSELKDKLLEQNLLRLVEPFSRVQIAHVAKLIKLPLDLVEAKLSEMILDKKLTGILDQGSGDLIVFEPTEEDKTYAGALDTIKELSGVVDKLYARAKKLHVAEQKQLQQSTTVR